MIGPDRAQSLLSSGSIANSLIVLSLVLHLILGFI